jgi:hypothetical protein
MNNRLEILKWKRSKRNLKNRKRKRKRKKIEIREKMRSIKQR